MRFLALVATLATAAAAAADPCPECARGDELIAKFSLAPLRAIDPSTLAFGDPLTADEYAHIVTLREQNPALARLGALDDAQLAQIAAALCHAATGPCVVATAHALACVADRCTAALPTPRDLVELPRDCRPYGVHKRSARYGLGFDWGEGWQHSRYPSDGGAWSLGIEGRLRVTSRFGAVARVDRSAGRDAATDADHNGRDDVSTGQITRITALAGPSIVLDNTRYEDDTRFAQLDLLGGYVATRSQPAEAGPAAGLDLSYQLALFRFGMRLVQGFGEARDATMLLAHVGLATGAAPPYDDEADCGAAPAARATRLALGMDFPLGGYGLSSQLGYMVPSLGFETAWHLLQRLDLMARADLLVYPGYERDRTLHQALLAGVRIDHQRRHSDSGYFTTVMAGYSHGVGFTPTSVGSGPIVDVSVGWGGQSDEAAGFLRLHARAGVGPDNLDYRAIFLSGGFELRLDPHSWRDRN